MTLVHFHTRHDFFSVLIFSGSKGTCQILSGHSLLRKVPRKSESKVCVGILDQAPKCDVPPCVCVCVYSCFRDHESQG